MFKLISRIISLVSIILIPITLTVVLAVWKGGEPFRWIGEKTEEVSRAIIDFGDIVDKLRDELIGKRKKAENTIKLLKDTMTPGEDNIMKQYSSEIRRGGKDKSGTINKNKGTK